MDHYQENKETWDKVSELYARKSMGLTMYDYTYDTLIEYINKSDATILDVGCGPGNITKYLLSQRPMYQILGIDVAPNMIQLARSHVPDARFLELDVRSINHLDGYYDAIVCGFCLPYISDQDRTLFIQESSKLILDSGLIYISFVAGRYEESRYQSANSGDRTFFYFHPLEDLQQELISSGFAVKNVIQTPYKNSPHKKEIHTVLIAQKK